MRLTTKSEYALIAAIDLAAAAESGPVSTRDIADRRDVPLKFLEQIMNALRQAGIVTSIRGARGGFVLAKDMNQLTVLEIVEAVEGPLAPTACDAASEGLQSKGCSKQSTCAAAHVWIKASEALRDEFSAITVGKLAQQQKSFDKKALR